MILFKNLRNYEQIVVIIKISTKKYPYYYTKYHPKIVLFTAKYGLRILKELYINNSFIKLQLLKDNIFFYNQEYSEQFLNEIVDTFNNIFNINRSIQHFRWKYINNAHDFIFSFGVKDKKIISLIAGYPMFWYNKKKNCNEKLLHIGDVFTIPEVRNLGKGKTSILVRTGRYFFSNAILKNYKLIYAVGTNVSYIMFKRYLDTDEIEPISFYILNKSNFNHKKLFLENFIWKVEIFSKFNNEFDVLFEKNKRKYGDYIFLRTSEYLNWRYADPDKNFIKIKVLKFNKLVGYSVIEIKNNTAIIGDIFFDLKSLKGVNLLINLIFKKFNVNNIELWLSKSCKELISSIKKIGFKSTTEPNNLKIVMVKLLDSIQPKNMADKIYYTKADFDLF